LEGCGGNFRWLQAGIGGVHGSADATPAPAPDRRIRDVSLIAQLLAVLFGRAADSLIEDFDIRRIGQIQVGVSHLPRHDRLLEGRAKGPANDFMLHDRRGRGLRVGGKGG
jgi:hypothetical protein